MKTMDNLVPGDELICIKSSSPKVTRVTMGSTYVFKSYYDHLDGTVDRGCIYVEGFEGWWDYDRFEPKQTKTTTPKNKTLKRSDLNALVRKGIEITMMAKSEDGDFDPIILSKKLVNEFLNN